MSLTKEEKKELLHIARSSIEARLRGVPEPEFNVNSPGLLAERGAFVTLRRNGRLRGCIGVFSSQKPLYRTVAEMAAAAAFEDPRFPPLSPGELDAIDIEISALSPLREIKDPREIEIGRHGVYIIKGAHRGVLLPQVAAEEGFDRETFLDHTCLKAGLEPGCWKEGARILVFEAEIFSEGGMEGREV